MSPAWPLGMNLDALARRWADQPTPWHNYSPTDDEWDCAAALAWRRFLYARLGLGERTLELRPGSGAGGRVGEGAAARERRWEVFDRGDGRMILVLCADEGPPDQRLTAWLEEGAGGTWRGRWVDHERGQVELAPLPEAPQATADWGRTSSKAASRCLVAVNLGGVMPRRVLDSHLTAARRWDAGYRVLTEADLPGWDGAGLQASAAKLLAFRFTTCQDVLLLDADALVSPTAPSPWELREDAEEVLLVANGQGGGSTKDGERQAQREWERLGRLLGDPRLPLGPVEAYCNAGFVLVGRRWQGLLEEAFALALRARLPWMEQTPLNYLLRLRGAPVRRLASEWNCTDPEVLVRFPMERHVYHYAGVKELMQQALC